MSTEKRCPFCWDTGDPIDQGGSAPKDYDIVLFTCDQHKGTGTIPPYLHLWDQAKTLECAEHKEDWEFTREIHSIIFDALAISPDEVEETCAVRLPNLKPMADKLVQALKNLPGDQEVFRKTLLEIMNVTEDSRKGQWISFAVEYYIQFLFASAQGRLPFPSFESYAYTKQAVGMRWSKIIYMR